MDDFEWTEAIPTVTHQFQVCQVPVLTYLQVGDEKVRLSKPTINLGV